MCHTVKKKMGHTLEKWDTFGKMTVTVKNGSQSEKIRHTISNRSNLKKNWSHLQNASLCEILNTFQKIS